jgi:glycosyltransferase involved in cell wall biosynthesis
MVARNVSASTAEARLCVASTAPRIGLVIGQLTVGGAEGQLMQVVRGLEGRFDLVVFSLSESPGALHDELVGYGAAVRTIGGRGVARARGLAQALNESRIELVHSWLFIANAYAVAARLFGARARIVTSARNCKVQGRASQAANALAFRASGAIVVNSPEVDAYIRRHYWAPGERIRLIPNGIDVEKVHPPSEPAAGDAAGAIVSIGRLVPQKNQALFLRAAAELLRDLPGQRFVIVGDGPLRAELETEAQRLHIAHRVEFVGVRRDVDEILRRASLFWLTSSWEGMPNVVLEALASGVPVIATDVGGTRELIGSGQGGVVVPEDDTSAFVTHSRELLRDPARLSALRGLARARAQEFSIPRMIEGLCRVYEEVLSRR